MTFFKKDWQKHILPCFPKKLGMWKVGTVLSLGNRSYRAFALLMIVFLASFLVIAMPAQSGYSATSCPNIEPKIQTIDERVGGELSSTSIDALRESPFKNYVSVISQHISTKICDITSNQSGINSSPDIELIFIYRPYTADMGAWNDSSVFEDSLTQPNISHSLDSPWARITVSQTPKPVVRGVFLWNERQFVFDQALISGISSSPLQPLMPIDESLFFQYVDDYVNSVLRLKLPPLPEGQKTYTVEQIREVISNTQVRFSKRVPADIFWLFRSSVQTTRGPFAGQANYALITTIQNAASDYTRLTAVLVDKLFTSKNTRVYYSSVLELKNDFALDEYQVKPLY
jgi:hypothetical protein